MLKGVCTMKRILALGLCLALLCPAARAAEGGGLCLLELQDPETALERADRLVLYRWGRRYPADRRLDLPPKGWRLEGRTEFPGRSHDMITKEIYIK